MLSKVLAQKKRLIFLLPSESVKHYREQNYFPNQRIYLTRKLYERNCSRKVIHSKFSRNLAAGRGAGEGGQGEEPLHSCNVNERFPGTDTGLGPDGEGELKQ